MTADSLWILWRQTYNESSEDKRNNRSRVFYLRSSFNTSSVTGCVTSWLENWKHKLDVRLPERGSYSALILLHLPGGLAAVVSNVHIWPSPSAWIPLKFQRHWDTIIWLIYETELWFASARAGDPPLTQTLPPTSLHLGGSDSRRTLMKAGRLHTSSHSPPADHPPLISSMTQDKRTSARYQRPGGHGHICTVPGSAHQRNHWYPLVSWGNASFKGQRKKGLHQSPRQHLQFPSFWRLDLRRKTGELKMNLWAQILPKIQMTSEVFISLFSWQLILNSPDGEVPTMFLSTPVYQTVPARSQGDMSPLNLFGIK